MSRVTDRGVSWLVAASDHPEQIRVEWRRYPRAPMLLPTGRRFDVLTVEERVGVEAVDVLRRSGTHPGPVLGDWRVRKVGFLVAVGADPVIRRLLERSRDGSAVPCRYVGLGGYVVVPGPEPVDKGWLEWIEPPNGERPSLWSRLTPLVDGLITATRTVRSSDQYGGAVTPAPLGAGDPE